MNNNKLVTKATMYYLTMQAKIRECGSRAISPLCSQRGSGYIDTAVVILISVVVGGLLLSGLYALFGDVVLPTLSKKIIAMFSYNG